MRLYACVPLCLPTCVCVPVACARVSVCAPQISCTKALKDWESKEGNPPLAEATVVRIYGGVPYEDGGKVKRAFITKLDNGLNGLKECTCVQWWWWGAEAVGGGVVLAWAVGGAALGCAVLSIVL